MKEKFRILIASGADEPAAPGPFQVKYSGEYVLRRLLPHLTDYKSGKGIVDKRCLEYRRRFDLDNSKYIAGLIVFPGIMPQIVDEPGEYIPPEIPEHNILIAAGVHPDLMIELIKKAADSGCRALIAPREHPSWIDSVLEKEIRALCAGLGIECVFPRPFCALQKSGLAFIDEFLEAFGIGKPEYEIILNKNGIIQDVSVRYSSPCGATYYVAAGLIGMKKQEAVETANKLWHCHACLASSIIDPDLGDSIMHIAARINLVVAKRAVENANQEGMMCW
ncbi:DUF166 domain-containing protein [Thermosediminibacter oceani]|uniref:Uncharacterized protein n=1 Tax=Thermosediminibacter oceani (strain ATCC BAA-1034 / DSM 16646 / JW/IW-1228P) TaxID=555079 RepID=D9S2D9_THEOJ|nr:DUF166 family protein [Thermosediminibacter oceani]ADL07566.1 Protein of unknown function DUF166 [Thermosediminibacter oceani DSM 16646]